MRIAFCLSLLFVTALPAIAGDVRTINTSCENALVKSEILAAKRKWWLDRVLNVRTHANFCQGGVREASEEALKDQPSRSVGRRPWLSQPPRDKAAQLDSALPPHMNRIWIYREKLGYSG